MQSLADRFNVVIVRIFGAAGHRKGLIDAMSSFGVKSILRRDIITLDKWFSDSKEICEYLTFRGDHRMSHVHLPVANFFFFFFLHCFSHLEDIHIIKTVIHKYKYMQYNVYS